MTSSCHCERRQSPRRLLHFVRNDMLLHFASYLAGPSYLRAGSQCRLTLVALADVGHQVLREGALHIVIRLPAPVAPGGAVVQVGGPAIDDPLALEVRAEADLRLGEEFEHPIAELIRRQAEAGHVVHRAAERFRRARRPACKQRLDRVGHRHEGDAHILAHEAGVGLALGGVVQHLRAVVAGAAAGHGEGADQAGEAQAAEIEHHRAVSGQLAVVLAVVDAQQLAVQLVAAVHRARGNSIPTRAPRA